MLSLAMQSCSKICSAAPDLVLRTLIIPRVNFFGVIVVADTGISAAYAPSVARAWPRPFFLPWGSARPSAQGGPPGAGPGPARGGGGRVEEAHTAAQLRAALRNGHVPH